MHRVDVVGWRRMARTSARDAVFGALERCVSTTVPGSTQAMVLDALLFNWQLGATRTSHRSDTVLIAIATRLVPSRSSSFAQDRLSVSKFDRMQHCSQYVVKQSPPHRTASTVPSNVLNFVPALASTSTLVLVSGIAHEIRYKQSGQCSRCGDPQPDPAAAMLSLPALSLQNSLVPPHACLSRVHDDGSRRRIGSYVLEYASRLVAAYRSREQKLVAVGFDR